MRTVYRNSFALTAAAFFVVAGAAAAQERPAGLLNNLEVRQLVARAEPGDNARLAVHFSALAIGTGRKRRDTFRCRKASWGIRTAISVRG
jgi:hypothetical protein